MSIRVPWFLVPNLLTLARVGAVPVMLWLVLDDRLGFAFWVFVAAGITDALDGIIAKRFNVASRLGGYLDALADKLLLVSIFVVLGAQGYLPLWLVILAVFRDAMIVTGVVLAQLLVRLPEPAPNFISKLNTVSQIVLAAFVLATHGLGVPAGDVVAVLIHVVAVTTIFSGAIYVVVWVRFMHGIAPSPAATAERAAPARATGPTPEYADAKESAE